MSSDPADPRAGDDRDGSWATSMPVIPDDARELARDVEAWRREVRWQQRRRRLERWTGASNGRGQLPGGAVVVIVILVGLVGAMLVVFTPRDGRRPVPPVPLALAAPADLPGTVGGLLPEADLTTASNTVLHARDLRPTVIALVPANCNCEAAVKTLVDQADAADMLPVDLVSTASQGSQLATLTTEIGANRVVPLRDLQSNLVDAIVPRGLSSLTVVPVHSDGVIAAIVSGFGTESTVERELERLGQPGYDQITADPVSP
jgi:hypothetical protein